jgi:uncharacterized protein
MPVYKYKTFEEAKIALWCREPDRAYFTQLNSLWALADRLSPCKYPSGVSKYRTIEEAKKQRGEWDLSNARRNVCRVSRSNGTEWERSEPEMEVSSISEIVAYLRDKKTFFHERFGVTRMGIFGSFAQGGQTTKSDIDLLVEFEKSKKNIHTFLQLRRLLEKELSRKVDLGFEHSLKPIVRENIKGRIIYV